jgi:membrane-bound ClpP family serine protease
MNMRSFFFSALSVGVSIYLMLSLGSRPARASEILVLRYHGVINPVSDQYLETGLEKALKDQALAVVLELDTPGGLDLSMRSMVKAMLASPIPVIVFVAPPGSRAASAGVFLVYASSLAVMAPGTNLGAAPSRHPGRTTPGQDSPEKVENDMAAYIGSITAKRGPNTLYEPFENGVHRLTRSYRSPKTHPHFDNVVVDDGTKGIRPSNNWCFAHQPGF